MSILRFFTSPTGRVGWRSFLFGLFAIAALEFAIATLRMPWLMLGAALVLSYPLFCLMAKRLHDMGAAAWPAALFVLLEIAVAWLGFSYLTDPDPGAGLAAPWEPDKVLAMRELGLVGMGLSFALVASVVFALLGPRVQGDNRYGPEPSF